MRHSNCVLCFCSNAKSARQAETLAVVELVEPFHSVYVYSNRHKREVILS
jgi:hypothetical protein